MVSIVIPTHGGGEGLPNVVDSLLKQTYKNVEIIVVDDNGYGTENQQKTANAIKPYVEKGVLQYITPQENRGGSSARNTGARAAKGKFLMFLDDDDTVSYDKIEKQVAALNATGGKCGFSYCSTKVFANGKLSNTIKAKKNGDILYDYLMGRICIGTGTALMLREVWESLGGYDESFIRHQDWEFFARVLNKYDAIAVPDAYFNRYITNRHNPRSIETYEKYADHYIAFLKQYAFRISPKKTRKAVNRCNSGIALRCIKQKEYKKFWRVLRKYDNLPAACLSFGEFCISVCRDKLIGKKT